MGRVVGLVLGVSEDVVVECGMREWTAGALKVKNKWIYFLLISFVVSKNSWKYYQQLEKTTGARTFEESKGQAHTYIVTGFPTALWEWKQGMLETRVLTVVQEKDE